jgi:hypothetical protein
MANKFWVGGSGIWDTSDTTHWSDTEAGAGGAAVPGTSDIAIMGPSYGGGNVKLGANVNVYMLGGSFGYVDFSTYSPTFCNIWMGASSIINLGSGVITLTNRTGDLEPFAFRPGCSVIKGTGKINVTSTFRNFFDGGGNEINDLEMSGSNYYLFQNNSITVNNLRMRSTAATSFWINSNLTMTIKGNFDVWGVAGGKIAIGANTTNVHLIKTKGVVSCNLVTITTIHAEGGARWFAGASSTNGGGNVGWMFKTGPTPIISSPFITYRNTYL